MQYVTLSLIHFCMLSSGCNAYRTRVDDVPPCQGQLWLNVWRWRAARLPLATRADDARRSQTAGVLARWPQLSRRRTKSLLTWVNVGARWLSHSTLFYLPSARNPFNQWKCCLISVWVAEFLTNVEMQWEVYWLSVADCKRMGTVVAHQLPAFLILCK